MLRQEQIDMVLDHEDKVILRQRVVKETLELARKEKEQTEEERLPLEILEEILEKNMLEKNGWEWKRGGTVIFSSEEFAKMLAEISNTVQPDERNRLEEYLKSEQKPLEDDPEAERQKMLEESKKRWGYKED